MLAHGYRLDASVPGAQFVLVSFLAEEATFAGLAVSEIAAAFAGVAVAEIAAAFAGLAVVDVAAALAGEPACFAVCSP